MRNDSVLTEFREAMNHPNLTDIMDRGKKILSSFSFSPSDLNKWSNELESDFTEAEIIQDFRSYVKQELVPALEKEFDITILYFLRGYAGGGWCAQLGNVNRGEAFWVYVARKNTQKKDYPLSKIVEDTLEECAHLFQKIHFLDYFKDRPQIRNEIMKAELHHSPQQINSPMDKPFCREVTDALESQARKISQQVIVCDAHLEDTLSKQNLGLLELLHDRGAHPWLSTKRLVNYLGQEYGLGAATHKISYDGQDFTQVSDFKENDHLNWITGRRILRNTQGKLESIYPFEVKRRLVFNKEEVTLRLRWEISGVPYLVYICPWRVMGTLKEIVVLLIEVDEKQHHLPFIERGFN